MLRISKMTDYAIVVSTHLGSTPGALAVSDLASATGIPQPTVAKVLKVLARAGLVASQRGAHGGYRLARAPEAITVAEIIGAIEGPIAVTECADDSEACAHEPSCEVRANWQLINSAVQGALAGITLGDMSQSGPAKLVQLARSGQEAAQRRAEGAPMTEEVGAAPARPSAAEVGAAPARPSAAEVGAAPARPSA
jgi:FeS assembly SUF system regulator